MKKKYLSYAQFFEDWILYCALEDIQNGFYVDVGAYDPNVLSVTKAFYDKGWNGINIEPMKKEYDKLCLGRPRDINLNIGAGAENTSLEFFISGSGTTCNPETIHRFSNINNIKREMIPVKKLSDILDEHLNANKKIHFLKIDVEGFERSVLEGMDFDKFRAWIIIIEATLPGTAIPCHDEWEDILIKNNYELGYTHSVNRYYVDKLMDSERLKKIKSGFADVWKKKAAYKIKHKYKRKKSAIAKLRRFMYIYIRDHDNLLSNIFRGIRAMVHGIRSTFRGTVER